MATTPQFVATPNVQTTKIENGDGTTPKTVFTAGASGSRVLAIAVFGNNDASLVLTLTLTVGAVTTVIAQYTLPLSSGVTAYTGIALFDPDTVVWLDAQEPTIAVPAGAVLKVGVDVAVTSGRAIDITVFGGDF